MEHAVVSSRGFTGAPVTPSERCEGRRRLSLGTGEHPWEGAADPLCPDAMLTLLPVISHLSPSLPSLPPPRATPAKAGTKLSLQSTEHPCRIHQESGVSVAESRVTFRRCSRDSPNRGVAEQVWVEPGLRSLWIWARARHHPGSLHHPDFPQQSGPSESLSSSYFLSFLPQQSQKPRNCDESIWGPAVWTGPICRALPARCLRLELPSSHYTAATRPAPPGRNKLPHKSTPGRGRHRAIRLLRRGMAADGEGAGLGSLERAELHPELCGWAGIIHGLCLDTPWAVPGWSMGCAWTLCELSMGCAWTLHDFAWTFHGLCLGIPWIVPGCSMGSAPAL